MMSCPEHQAGSAIPVTEIIQGLSINYLPAYSNSAIRLIKWPLYTGVDYVFWAGSHAAAGDNFWTTFQTSVILVGLMDLTYR